jgi:hypothetical protein
MFVCDIFNITFAGIQFSHYLYYDLSHHRQNFRDYKYCIFLFLHYNNDTYLDNRVDIRVLLW